MSALTKPLTPLLAAVLATTFALLLLALGPAPSAADDGASPATATVSSEDTVVLAQTERVPLAETPRDRVGLILLATLAIWGVLAWINMRRQLKGERPQASGEFRWR